MIRVKLNGEAKALDEPLTLHKLMQLLRVHKKNVAVAINYAVIPHSEFKKKYVRNGDQVDIIQAVGGG